MEQKYFRVKTVAEILRCRHSAVLDWIKRGRVKARLNSRGDYLIPQSEFHRLLKTKQRKGVI
jgi:excisionase family DNA binding protein